MQDQDLWTLKRKQVTAATSPDKKTKPASETQEGLLSEGKVIDVKRGSLFAIAPKPQYDSSIRAMQKEVKKRKLTKVEENTLTFASPQASVQSSKKLSDSKAAQLSSINGSLERQMLLS